MFSPHPGSAMRRPIHPPPTLTVRLRRVLGRLRRSAMFERASGFAGRHTRAARQRLQRRFVRGVWLRTEDYLAREPLGGSIVHRAFAAARFRIDGPTYAGRHPAVEIGHPMGAGHPARNVFALSAPWVVGDDGAVVASDRRLLWDLSYHWPGRPHQHPAYLIGQPAVTPLPGTTVTLAAMGAAENYFHFLCNSLARLAYLPTPDARCFAPDRFLVSGAVTPLVADALALFGIARDRIVGTADLPATRPERLIAPALVTPPFIVPAHLCDFLHDRILGAVGVGASPPCRRLLIDRSDAPKRRIRNLPALRTVLDAFGLEVVQLAGLSLAAQARLFHDAELIVANHGAALANLVFCRPGTRVLQVLAPGMTEREYRTLSQHRRLRHDYLCADFASSADAARPRKDRDLLLDPALLRSVLAAELPLRRSPRLPA